MTNICIGAPSTRQKRNLTEFTLMIHPTNMMNGLNKSRGIYNTKKREGLIEQGIVKNHLEILEVENDSLYTHIYSLYYALIV